MTQFLITTPDGRVFGVVLDRSPMTPEQVDHHRSNFGARTLQDVHAYARFVGPGSTVARLAGRPKRFAASGRHPRRYAASSHCVVLECAA